MEDSGELVESFKDLLFLVVEKLSNDELRRSAVVMSSFWRSRNEKLWKGEFTSAATTVFVPKRAILSGCRQELCFQVKC